MREIEQELPALTGRDSLHSVESLGVEALDEHVDIQGVSKSRQLSEFLAREGLVTEFDPQTGEVTGYKKIKR